MPKLNKTQLYAISWLHSQNKSTEDIANDLGLNVEQVIKAMEKTTSIKTKDIKTGSEPVAPKQPELMINKTAGKGNSGVSIMTKEASERNDALKNKTSGFNNRSDAIYRPKN